MESALNEKIMPESDIIFSNGYLGPNSPCILLNIQGA